MKRINKLLILLLIIIFPKNALAAPSGSIVCHSISATVGSTVSVSITGSSSEEVMWDISTYSNDESKLKVVSGDRIITDDFSTSLSRTVKFKAVVEGTVTVSTSASMSNYSGEKIVKNDSCTITIGNKKEEVQTPKSSDNSLKSLEVEGLNLTPEFNSDTLEYNVTIKSDEKTKIKINADKNDSKASIDGTGEKEVDLGLNKFEINVTAENGSVRTYIINVTVNEKNPITVKIDGKKYILMRKINGIEVPDGFEKKIIKIKGKEVEAFVNSNSGFTLVVLTDSNNKSSLFIYKNGKYIKYSEFKNSTLRLLILKAKKKDIPYHYKECTFNIDDEEVIGYQLSDKSRFKLVYALNIDTNEEDFYLYDLDQKTFQRFYNQQVLIYIDLIKKIKVGLIIIGAITLIMVVIIISLFTSNYKIKKRVQNIADSSIKKVKPEEKEIKKSKNFLDE